MTDMLSLVVDAAVRDRVTPAMRARLRSRVARMLRAAGLSENGARPLEAALQLTDDAGIRALNRDYRKKDAPTDVLAFAMREGEGGHLHPEVLGDIVISVATARRQSRRKRPMRIGERDPLLAELLFLAAHGLCHLLGYDHRDDAEEAEMNARMQSLLDESARRGPTRPA
jgi:probable rRNA maturation factor